MASILWTLSARDDLRATFEYISLDSPTYAAASVERFLDAVDRLRKYPRLGRVVPEYRDTSLRELIVGNYRIVYRLRRQQVRIVAVVQGSRDMLKSAGKQPWDFG